MEWDATTAAVAAAATATTILSMSFAIFQVTCGYNNTDKNNNNKNNSSRRRRAYQNNYNSMYQCCYSKQLPLILQIIIYISVVDGQGIPNIFFRGFELGLANSGNDGTFSDPEFNTNLWMYDMINIAPVWRAGYFGKGINIRINDDGLDRDNAEFFQRIDVNSSCTNGLYDTNVSSATTTTSPFGQYHGTVVASILGGEGDNEYCAVGIAPQVTLSSCNIFESDITNAVLATKYESIDISQNSWGYATCEWDVESFPILNRYLQEDDEDDSTSTCSFTVIDADGILDSPCDVCESFERGQLTEECEVAIINHCWFFFEQDSVACIDFLDLFVYDGKCYFHRLDQESQLALVTGILKGRDGKGIIYVFSSGNDYEAGADTNYGGFTNSRFTISVGAVGQDGRHAAYSTPGASLFVTAPAGDYETTPDIVTSYPGNGNCLDAGDGTSFSCPIVSGVIALMLESNPNLTWRDVQHILVRTSRKPKRRHRQDDSTRTINDANRWHSNLYGFGIIDAFRAVQMTKSWQLVANESMILGDSGIIDLPLDDYNNNNTQSQPTIDVITMFPRQSDSIDFIAETVVVYVDVEHFSRGHLQITLTSPAGTTSILSPGKRPENTFLDIVTEQWKLSTVKNWDESAIGDWIISVQDIKEGDVDECADLPFLGYYEDWEWTCEDIEFCGLCFDGMINGTASTSMIFDIAHRNRTDGLTPVEACCSCGGGVTASEVDDRLIRWRLAVYGTDVLSPDAGRQGRQGPSSVSSSSTTTTTTTTANPIRPSIPDSNSNRNDNNNENDTTSMNNQYSNNNNNDKKNNQISNDNDNTVINTNFQNMIKKKPNQERPPKKTPATNNNRNSNNNNNSRRRKKRERFDG